MQESSIISYWKIDAVSNSELTALARACNGLPDNTGSLFETFSFGSLVDAMLTEYWRCDRSKRRLLNENLIGYIEFTPDEWSKAEAMADRARRHPFVSKVIAQMKGQYVYVRTIEYDYQGNKGKIKAKCKFDQFSKSLSMGADYKTTACSTREQFIEAIDHFNWDKQGAWYMDCAKIDRHMIIGLSKNAKEIFIYTIQRGDEMYNRGVAKYSKWAYMYDILNLKSFS